MAGILTNMPQIIRCRCGKISTTANIDPKVVAQMCVECGEQYTDFLGILENKIGSDAFGLVVENFTTEEISVKIPNIVRKLLENVSSIDPWESEDSFDAWKTVMSRSFARFIADTDDDIEIENREKIHQKYMNRAEQGKFSWPPWISDIDQYTLSYLGVKSYNAFYKCPNIAHLLKDFYDSFEDDSKQYEHEDYADDYDDRYDDYYDYDM